MLLQVESGKLARPVDWGRERSGYAHESYVQSLAEFGQPLRLERSAAALLIRDIPGSPYHDGIGAYPFFACEDFAALAEDFDNLGGKLVSAAVVPDIFSAPAPEVLSGIFDIVIPFKTHYLADLEIGFDSYLHRHHRRYAGKGRTQVEVRLAQQSAEKAEEWVGLYQHLVARRAISGLRAFTPRALALQLQIPDCHYFGAVCGSTAVGALVCYLDRGVAYAHLVSTTPEGQALMAQYALYWEAIEYFRGRAKWFALGSVAGSSDGDDSDGLGFFKKGWATATCRAYFCGRIFDQNRYDELCGLAGQSATRHFPAYRGGVFG